MINQLMATALSVVVFTSCQNPQEVATPTPTSRMAKVSGKSLGTLKKGHVIYRSHCVKCHENRLPSTATVPEYHRKIAVMATRAGLTPSEEAALQAYLDEFSDR